MLCSFVFFQGSIISYQNCFFLCVIEAVTVVLFQKKNARLLQAMIALVTKETHICTGTGSLFPSLLSSFPYFPLLWCGARIKSRATRVLGKHFIPPSYTTSKKKSIGYPTVAPSLGRMRDHENKHFI